MTALFHWIYCLPVFQVILLTAAVTVCFRMLHRRYWSHSGWRWLCAGLLALWLLAVLTLTLFCRSSGNATALAYPIPFSSYLRCFREDKPELLRSNFMNLLLFYPGGLLLASFLPRHWNRVRLLLVTVAVAFLLSLAIELSQYRWALGQLEADDVLHNTLGALLGAALCPHPRPKVTPALNQPQQLFLDILKAGLQGTAAELEEMPQPDTQNALLQLAGEHKLLPLILTAWPRQWPVPAEHKRFAFHQAALQMQKNVALLALYNDLRQAGYHPLVVKGILCRELYPQGELRPSSDEDLFVPSEEFSGCCRALQHWGFAPTGEEDTEAYEIGWRKGILYIELHRHLFPPESHAYGELNRFFPHPGENGTAYPSGVCSLSVQDHLLYLLLHAYKHFLHSGFGIRQVCDICLWARQYESRIQWPQLFAQCESCGAEGFAAAVFGIGHHWLGIDLTVDRIPSPEYCLPLLCDILSAGIYGSAQDARLHSATMTLHAVEARRSDIQRGMLTSLLPPLSAMQRKYACLKKYPLLLPFAWLHRIGQYLCHGGNAAASATIGSDRIALLKHYGILK